MDIDFYSPEVVADPWAALTRVREAGPVVWNERGYWMTARDRICRQIFNRPGPIGQEGMIQAFFGAEAFIAIDDKKRHNALRNVWVSAFSRQAVAELATFVRDTTNKMLDALEPALRNGEEVDLMAGLGRPLPAYVIAHMLGVSDDMIPQVVVWSDAMADATMGGFPIDYANDPYWLAGERAKKDFGAYLIDQFAFRRRSPGSDLISQIVHSELAHTLSEDAMVMNTRQLIFAGNETTAKWLGHSLQAFAERPDVRQAVDADRSILPGALEEILRWQGVVHAMPRGVKGEGVTVGDVLLKDGDEMLILLGGANRDPERYDDPDALNIYRTPQPHLAFGFGMHTCIGAVLARMEVLEAATAVLNRIPAYHITRPVNFGLFSVRGPSELWVQLDKS